MSNENNIEAFFDNFASTFVKYNINQEIANRVQESIGYDVLESFFKNSDLSDIEKQYIQNRFEKFPTTPFFLLYVFEVLILLPVQEQNLDILMKYHTEKLKETKIDAIKNVFLEIITNLELVIYIFENFAKKDKTLTFFLINFMNYFRNVNEKNYFGVMDEINSKLDITREESLSLFSHTAELVKVLMIIDNYYSYYTENESAEPDKIKFIKPFFNEYTEQVINVNNH